MVADYTIETVNLWDHARGEIEAARSAGTDPLEIADTHERTAAIIRHIVKMEGEL
ncbi:hypothetical protein [Microbacterium sp.]|uniref:hypothetical protein n=1 Tax=Microbacterium sp. TaxID=51671 RepID=UPI0039E67462